MKFLCFFFQFGLDLGLFKGDFLIIDEFWVGAVHPVFKLHIGGQVRLELILPVEVSEKESSLLIDFCQLRIILNCS